MNRPTDQNQGQVKCTPLIKSRTSMKIRSKAPAPRPLLFINKLYKTNESIKQKSKQQSNFPIKLGLPSSLTTIDLESCKELITGVSSSLMQLEVSRIISLVLIGAYIWSIVFQNIKFSRAISFGEEISDVSNTYYSDDNEEIESGCMVTPGGHKYYVPISVEYDLKPFISKSLQSLESGIAFYREYGVLSGFSVRRSAEKTHSDGTIISKYLLCNRAGFTDVKMSYSEGSKSKVGKRRRTKSGRCGCEAKLVLKFSPGNIYYVSNFVEAHNHPLVPEDYRYFLKGSCKMSTCSMNFVFDASKVNIGTMKSFRMMKELVKGYENVDATSREFRNFDRDLKTFIGVVDAQMIIEKLKVKQETDPGFFYAHDVDPAGNITKLFWADSTARRNYELYGDVVSFDPTFNTNKYNMVFAPFTGVDKHNKYVTFAYTLLSKEDVTHFT
ncbi:hypothetical protein POM88_052118 [Heracleum sosnowskyi]|uniref:Protein FAR1-RELATED SEQUENCE n=1 Tax=Heracleum sosnowskyi TaxID=360622 RepID=A0AAD8GSI7_9APIA|nr:hypothetical protein POM88_052118 [Heracleum sosnowskyi]